MKTQYIGFNVNGKVAAFPRIGNDTPYVIRVRGNTADYVEKGGKVTPATGPLDYIGEYVAEGAWKEYKSRPKWISAKKN